MVRSIGPLVSTTWSATVGIGPSPAETLEENTIGHNQEDDAVETREERPHGLGTPADEVDLDVLLVWEVLDQVIA